jgi:FkbM family methyltransferase
MRIARGTRYLPSFRGLTLLLRLYRALLRHNTTYRIEDFDGDISLDVSVCECIGINLWHAPEQYEREERRLFCSEIKPGSIVLDIGANIGIFTLLAAKRGAKVFAIEADPHNAALLRKHIEINGFSERVTVFEMAAAEAQGPLMLYQHDANRGGSSLYGQGIAISAEGIATSVDGRTVDSLNLPPIDVCKIDIEGAESVALRGMRDTIKRSPNLKLLVEYSEPHGKSRAAELLQFIRETFSIVSVVNGPVLYTESPPTYCNLWCSGLKMSTAAP